MPNVPLILAVWLHSLAAVALIGYYLLLSLVYLPYFGGEPGGVGISKSLSAISARMRPWLLGSLLVFAGSGAYLTLANGHYLGLGNFGNVWSTLMLVKHALVAAMVVLAFLLDATLSVEPRVGPRAGLAAPASARKPAIGLLGRTRLIVGGQSALGSIVLLLTAAAQV